MNEFNRFRGNPAGKDSSVAFDTARSAERKFITFGSVLIVGMGSTAGVVVPIINEFADNITCVSRDSNHGKQILQDLIASNGKISTHGVIDCSGYLDRFVLGYQNLQQITPPDTIFLCTSASGYSDNVKSLAEFGMIKRNQRIIVISSRLGSGTGIEYALQEVGYNPKEFTVVTFSNYFGATKQDNGSQISFYTRAIKKKMTIGLSREDKEIQTGLRRILEQYGIDATFVDKTLTAEVYNSNTFIHAQLVMTQNVLTDIFSSDRIRNFLYRPEPDGCISNESCLRMVQAEQEINAIYTALFLPKVNFLKLLLDAYPIPNLIHDEGITDYPTWNEQQKLHYIRECFLQRQRDPFTGEPHRDAVKLPQAKIEQGKYIVPRIPAEDYTVIVLLTDIASRIGLTVKTLSAMRNTFEQFLLSLKSPTDMDIQDIEIRAQKLAGAILNKQGVN